MARDDLKQGVTIRVLGPLEVLVGDAPAEMPPSKKTRALLAYLALSERRQRRERLCEIFWDLPDDPKGALRWSLSKIRRIVNAGQTDRLDADRASVALDRAGIAIDWVELKEAVAEGLERLSTERLERLAASLRGAFLEDLALPRCPEFEAWRMAESAQVDAAAARLLRALVERLRDEPERAIRHALQLRLYAPEDDEVDALIAGLQRRAGRLRPATPRMQTEPRETVAPAAVAEPPTPARLPSRINFCTASDGVRLAWGEAGEGPPIVRGPHWMTHLEYDWESPVWGPWMAELSRSNRLVRFDQRCNGLSDRGVADISFERMVDDLATVVDAAGLEKFVLLGISQSAAISVAYAVRDPERVRGLVLYGGFAKGWRARGDPQEIARREAMNVLLQQGWGGEDPTFRQLFTTMFRPAATAEEASWYNELQRRAATPEDAYRLAQASGDMDVTDLLGQVRAPTLVLHARGDRVAPLAAGRMLAEKIPGAEFVELESDNHILGGDEPAFRHFVEACRAFTDRVFAAPRPALPETAELGAAAATATGSGMAAPPSEARRRITVLDADIVSPLQAFEELDAEFAMTALRPLVEVARRIVEANGGDLLEASEAGLSAVFGGREPSEVHAVLAARAALALQAEIHRASAGRSRTRIALDTGDAIVSLEAGRVRGASGAVIRHARQLSQALRRATIAVTDRVRASAGGYLRLEPMHRNEHPGLVRDAPVHELLALNSALSRWYLRAHRGLSRFVGRRVEVELLDQLWRHVREGRGQAIVLSAEPGVGKSRLTHEFLTAMAAEDCQIIEGGALEFDRDVAYAVIKRLLRSFLAISDADSAEVAGDKLVRGIERHGANAALESPLAFVLELPVHDPEWEEAPSDNRARRIAEAVREILGRAARAAPLLVLVEDMHWIDRESRAVIERLLEGIDRQRILFMLTCRPEFRHDWGGRSAVHTLRLHPLSIEDSELLVRALVGEHPSVATLRRLLVERTDGTPLFIEETVRSLAEAGRIVGTSGAYVAPHPIVDIETGSSVEPVIAARIERLAPRERALLQTASAVGRNAPRPLLKALTGLSDADLAEAVAALERAELMFEVMSFPEPEYTFKHALIRRVAYASLLVGERRHLHAEALRAIERLHAESLAEHIEDLARHAYHAGLWDQAARYSARAAERAVERSAYRPAAVHLEHAAEALDMLEETPERIALAIDVRTQMRLAYMVTGDYPSGVTRLKEARDLAVRIGDTDRRIKVLLHLSFLHSTFGRIAKAVRAADDAKRIAAEHGLDRLIAEGDLAASQAMLLRGDAREALARLTGYYDAFTTDWRRDRFGFLVTRAVWYLGSLAQACALVGEFAEAARNADEAAALAEETRRPLDAYAAQYYRNLFQSIRGPTEAELERMRLVAEECLDRAPFPFSPWLLASWGYAQMRAGHHAEAEQTLERALDAARGVNMLHMANLARGLLAWVRALGGDEGARDELLWASRRAEKDSDEWLRIRVLEALAGIDPNPAGATARLEEAARIAESCGFRPLHARALAAFARRAEDLDLARARAAAERAASMFDAMGLTAEAAEVRRSARPASA